MKTRKFYAIGANGSVDPRLREGSNKTCSKCFKKFSFWDDLNINFTDTEVRCASCKHIKIKLIRKYPNMNKIQEIKTTLGSSVKLISKNINETELRFEKLDKNESWGDLSNESILNFLEITDKKIYKLQFYDEKYIGSEFKIWLCPLDWNPSEEEPYFKK